MIGVKYVLCMLAIVCPGTVKAADIAIEMKALTESVRPGLAAVVEVAAVNQSREFAEVHDLYGDPYFSQWSWSWSWNEGRSIQAIRGRDILDAVPDIESSPIKLAAGERVIWFVVVPVPAKLAGSDSASLRIGYSSMGKEVAESSCSFKVSKPFVLPDRNIAPDWFKKMLPTGTDVNALGWLHSQKPYLKGWFSETDASLLLGWFCINLARNEFDERAWSRLQAEAEDFRAIRNARLESALRSSRLTLSSKVVQGVLQDLQADDSLTQSLRKQLKATK